MRGYDVPQTSLFSYVDMEARIPSGHPLRAVRALVDEALKPLDDVFDRIYSDDGRISIPPEHLMRALLLQVLYTIRSERQLVEQLDYNILFRWFVGLGMDDRVWHHSTFTKNRDRLLAGDVCQRLLAEIVRIAERRRLLSKEHFSVDGTLLEAWASHKSFRRKDGNDNDSDGNARNATRSWKTEKRSNRTHASTTDPDARLARKGPGCESRLAYQGNILIDNRHGLVVGSLVKLATGNAEIEASGPLIDAAPRRQRITVGADKKYDQHRFCRDLRSRGATPHPAARSQSVLDRRTTRHPGYRMSQVVRKRVEEPFGWGKTVGLLRKLHHRGEALVDSVMALTMAGYNLVRLRNLART